MVKFLNEIKEKKKWKRDEEYQKVFEELKNKITSQLVLTLLKREEKFKVETNISEYAIRGCHKLYSACISTTSRPIFTN